MGAEMNKIFSWAMIAALPLAAIVLSLALTSESPPDLRAPAGREWLTNGGDWNNSRYSTLSQINRENVARLKGAWVTHLGSSGGITICCLSSTETINS